MVPLDQSPTSYDPFDLWLELKTNSRIHSAMWLQAGLPAAGYAPIDDFVTIAESTLRFRQKALSLGPSDLKDLRGLVMEQLRIDGYPDLRPRKAPETKWNKRLKGARPIAWLPGAVPKEC